MTLKFEQSPFFGIHVAHISNNAPFIPIYFAGETWLLETTSQPANLFTLKMNTNLRCRVPNSKAVNTQLYTTRWDCKYQCFRGRRNCRNFRQFSVLFAYGLLYPHGPLQLSRVTLLVSNSDTVQLPKGKRMEEAAKPSDCSGPGLAPPSQDTKSLTHSLYHVQGQLTTSCAGAWYCHGMVRNQCSLNKSPYLASIRPSNSSTAPRKGAIRHKTVCCSKVGKYLYAPYPFQNIVVWGSGN